MRCSVLLLAAVTVASGVGAATESALADEPLAGARLFTVSHGQPFCTSRGELQALLRAQIAHAPYGPETFPTCRFVSDNAIVAIDDDVPPYGRYMHVVRARAALPFGAVDGYTYSVGLYPYPVRQPPVNFRID